MDESNQLVEVGHEKKNAEKCDLYIKKKNINKYKTINKINYPPVINKFKK